MRPTLNSLYRSVVLSHWADWQDFRVKHPRIWALLYQGYRVYQRTRELEYRRIQRRFRAFTMIPPRQYRDNPALCDSVRHVPGTVVECGTWKGGMSAGMASLLGPDRTYYLFDSFDGLPPAGPADRDIWGQSGTDWQAATIHNDRAPERFAREAMRRSGAPHVHIQPGWFEQTLPQYDGGPIAVLRADGDWYCSTMETLTHLYRYVVPGGIIIFDDHYYWDGCSKAVHDFLAQTDARETIHQFRGS